MAEALIATAVPADQPVDLLVLAFAIHDVQPGRATATYLSSVCPGTPLSFAICDQGSAAAFTGLRIARDYVAYPAGAPGTGGGRALLIVLEQAVLPYPAAVARPARHRGVAMLFEREQSERELFERGQSERGQHEQGGGEPAAGRAYGAARLVGLRQRPGVAAADVAEHGPRPSWRSWRPAVAGARAGQPGAGSRVDRAAAGRLRVGAAGQPATGLWWQLLDELAGEGPAEPVEPDLLVAADYDPDLGYLCLAAFSPAETTLPRATLLKPPPLKPHREPRRPTATGPRSAAAELQQGQPAGAGVGGAEGQAGARPSAMKSSTPRSRPPTETSMVRSYGDRCGTHGSVGITSTTSTRPPEPAAPAASAHRRRIAAACRSLQSVSARETTYTSARSAAGEKKSPATTSARSATPRSANRSAAVATGCGRSTRVPRRCGGLASSSASRPPDPPPTSVTEPTCCHG